MIPKQASALGFFTVYADNNDKITGVNTDKISSVDTNTARKYAEKVISENGECGWINGFRYKITDTSDGKTVVFVNGEANKSVTSGLQYTVLFVLLGSFLVILMPIIIISKRAVKPTYEAYEKQKQFVTDANHELKTPLTLILSNIDIVESEIGKNEWLEDIRSEGERLSALINQLVTLSRMDEDASILNVSEFDLSGTVLNTVSDFEGLAELRKKELFAEVEPNVLYSGDEGLIRQLMSILHDNAVKYCDPDGEIIVRLRAKGHGAVITVENTYSDIDNIEPDKLFDQFYRSDKSRSLDGSFGVGLSIAQSIANKHKGNIIACKKDSDHISFKVTLKRI